MGHARRQPPNAIYLLRMNELGLQEFLVSNIPSNHGSSGNPARCVLHGRNSQGNINV
jgi:hypothetical protein